MFLKSGDVKGGRRPPAAHPPDRVSQRLCNQVGQLECRPSVTEGKHTDTFGKSHDLSTGVLTGYTNLLGKRISASKCLLVNVDGQLRNLT